jgi:TolB-like protein
MTAPDIFLSYNREDQAVAKRFAESFVREGFDVWWDVTLRSGEAYDRVTEEALRMAKAVVVLWSKRSVESRWVRAEASIADENGTLVPAKIEACDLSVMFRLTQTADLSHWQGEAHDPAWQSFLGDVRRMVGNEFLEVTAKPISAPITTDSGIPIVAVLPITCRRGNEELEFFAEDLTEAITAELSHDSYCDVTVATVTTSMCGGTLNYREQRRELGARYLFVGKVRSAADTIQLNMQMIATAAGKVVWSKRFVGKAEWTEASLEKIAITVASELSEQLLTAEVNRATTKPGPHSGWDHFLRAVAVLARQSTDSIQKAIDECRHAVAAAPDFGLAHALLVSALGARWRFSAEFDEAQIQEMRAHTQRALQLSGDDPTVIAMLIGFFGVDDPETALNLAKRAVELYPNHPRSHFVLASANLVLGNVSEAIAALEHQERLTPFDRTRYMSSMLLGICRMLEGELIRAEEELDKSLAIHPDFAAAIKWKAIVVSQRGKGGAPALIKRLREIEPAITINQHVREMMTYSGISDRLGEPVAILRRLWQETEGHAASG